MRKTRSFQPKRLSVEERFWLKVKRDPIGCWIWGGACVNGYGRFNIDGRSEIAARIAWALANGPIPDGMLIRHLCNNGANGCVRPSHLLPGTFLENIADTKLSGAWCRPHYPRTGRKKTSTGVVQQSGLVPTEVAPLFRSANRRLLSDNAAS